MEGTPAKKKMSVSCPVEGKDGKTYWRSMGIGFMNRDGAISIILEGLPVNGRLYVSEWPAWKDGARQREMPPFSDAPPTMPAPTASDLPF
jgi:hypothetical protein